MLHTEAHAIRAILAVDSDNGDALGKLLGDIQCCENCTALTITHLAVTIVELLDAGRAAGRHGEGWRAALTDRLAYLLDAQTAT
jgi:hypothetical protein